MIKRTEYLDNLIALRDKQVIKVITGVRRCGKSTLFDLYIDYLKESGVDDNQVISINLEDLENTDLLDYKALYKYISSKLVPNKKNYIFIDEVQKCSEFEKAVDEIILSDETFLISVNNFDKKDTQYNIRSHI